MQFPTLIDAHGTTSQLFGFKVVPNGILVDEEGIILYMKYGGFSIDNTSDVGVVEHFIRGGEPGPSPTPGVRYRLNSIERDLVETRLRLGHLLDALGRRDEAIQEWQAALRIDPENLVIRKQIWAARHPEKFFPTIDVAWQQEQLRQERAAEIASGICGPDGCPLPLSG